MATIGLKNPNLVDILSRTDPDGSVSTLIETAAQSLPIIEHATYTECNNGDKHKITVRTDYPEPVIRMYNQYVDSSKSTSFQAEDTTAMFEAFPWVDKALADKNGNADAYRASEMVGHLEGFNVKMARNIIYGKTLDEPGSFLGIEPRYSDPTAPSGRNLINGGGTGSDNTSIYAVTWGPRGAQLLYPKDTPVGFTHKDLGVQRRQNGEASMLTYEDHVKWQTGLTLGDFRACGRICNIDVSDLTKDASAGADLIDLLIDLDENVDTSMSSGIDIKTGDLVQGRTVYYVSRKIAAFLRKQALNKVNVDLRVEEVGGRRVTMFGEHEIARLDVISETEAAVTGF